jgi:hypothetical protein
MHLSKGFIRSYKGRWYSLYSVDAIFVRGKDYFDPSSGDQSYRVYLSFKDDRSDIYISEAYEEESEAQAELDRILLGFSMH